MLTSTINLKEMIIHVVWQSESPASMVKCDVRLSLIHGVWVGLGLVPEPGGMGPGGPGGGQGGVWAGALVLGIGPCPGMALAWAIEMAGKVCGAVGGMGRKCAEVRCHFYMCDDRIPVFYHKI